MFYRNDMSMGWKQTPDPIYTPKRSTVIKNKIRKRRKEDQKRK